MRVRDTSVTHEIDGDRRLSGEFEHSGDAMAEGPSEADDNDTESPNRFNAIDSDGEVHSDRNGLRSWADGGLARVTRRELLELLTEKQGALALLLMNGLNPADAARTLGISPAAVAQTMKRMRERLRTMRSE